MYTRAGSAQRLAGIGLEGTLQQSAPIEPVSTHTNERRTGDVTYQRTRRALRLSRASGVGAGRARYALRLTRGGLIEAGEALRTSAAARFVVECAGVTKLAGERGSVQVLTGGALHALPEAGRRGGADRAGDARRLAVLRLVRTLHAHNSTTNRR